MNFWTIVACIFLFGLPVLSMCIVLNHTSLYKLSHDRVIFLILALCGLVILFANYKDYAWIAAVGCAIGLLICWRDGRRAEIAQKERESR